MEDSDSTSDFNGIHSNLSKEDDIEIITHEYVRPHHTERIYHQTEDEDQNIIIDEADEPNLKVLSHWLVNEVGILPSSVRLYCSQLFSVGIGSIERLGKKLSKEPSTLKDLGFKPDDIDEIFDVLKKDGLLQIPSSTQTPTSNTNTNTTSMSMSLEQPTEVLSFSRAIGAMSPSGSSHYQYQYSSGNTNASNYYHHHHHHSNSIDSPVAQATEETKDTSREKALSIGDDTTTYVSIAQAQFESVRRRVRRGENSEKFKELVNEATGLCETLRTAIEGKMELAVAGELHRFALFVEHSFEKQKAMYRANCAGVVITALLELGGSPTVCEKAMIVIAILCRHSDENKASVSYEHAKALGNAGACECVTAGLVKYAEDAKIVEVALDAIRCLCCLESNQARFGATTACETVGRCLCHPVFSNNPELCCWICRTIGHLGASLDENRELIGSVGACEHIIVVMQRFQHNLNLCIELCWAIRNVAPIYNNRARFANEHGPECIAAVYKFHHNSENFAIEACRALGSLIASEDDDIIPRIANSGVLSYIMKSYRRYNDSEFLARWVFHLMYYISCQTRLIPRLLSVDILSILSSTLDTHAGYEPLAEWGLRTVAKLTKLPGIISKMRNAGLCEVTVSTVQRQAISAKVCGHGVLAIGELATDSANHDRLSTAAASEAIIGALKRHDKDIDVVTNACYAIHYLCMTENINSWMGANGGCEAVTNALIKHTVTNLIITRSACRAVGSLAYHDEGNISRLSAADACTAIVKALRTYATDAEVAEYTCRAIYNLCYDSINVKEFGKKGACGWVVTVLQTHLDKTQVVSQACLAIHGLAVKIRIERVHAGNTRKLVEKGAIETVVAAMQKFPKIAEVQQSAAMAIASLGRLEANRDALGASGACELIVTALVHHPSNGEVMGKLALAVEVLATGSDAHKVKFAEGHVVEMLLQVLHKQEKYSIIVAEIFRALIIMIQYEPSRLLIRSEPSCKQIVKALRLHEKDPITARWGCNLIYVASIDDIARSRLGSFKACEVVVTVLNRQGQKDSQVAAWGCKALFALSVLESNKLRFGNSDSCHALMRTLKEFHEDILVAEWACAAVVSIAQLEGNRTRLGSSGGCQTIQATLAKQQHSEVITRLVCEAIFELSQETTNRQSFGTAGTCETLVSSLSAHSNSASVSQQICRAISALARNSPTNADKFGVAGVCELLGEAQRTHTYNVSFAEWSCAAVTALSDTNVTNQTAFGAAGICETLITLLKTHRKSEIVVAQSTRAVRAVSHDHSENTKLFSNAGIVGTTLASLKAHAASFYVAENCGWILTRIPTPPFIDGAHSVEETVSATSTAPFSTAGVPTTPTPVKDLYKSVPAWDLLASVQVTHAQREQTCKWIASAIQVFAERGKLSHIPTCDAMITTLNYHMDKEKILYQILMTIGELASNNMENSNRLVRQRICEYIDTVLANYMSIINIEPELIFSSCFRAIAGLVNNNPSVQDKIYTIPTLIKNILKALYNDLESEQVSKWGCAAIAVLCHKHRLLQYKVGPVGNYLTDIIQIHKNSREINLEICRLISRLSHGNITNRNRLGASGICDEIPKIIHNFGMSGSLPPSPSNSSSTANKTLHRGSAIPLVAYSDEQADELVTWAVRAIADLSANNPNNQTKLGLSGCCEALVMVLRKSLDTKPKTPEEAIIIANKIKYTCWAIGNMVQLGKGPTMVIDESAGSGVKLGQFKALRTTNTKKNTARFGAVGLPQLIKAVLIKYADNNEVMIWCLRAVNNLAKSRTTKAQLIDIGIVGPVQLLASGANASDSVGSDPTIGAGGTTIGRDGGLKDYAKEVMYWAALAKATLLDTNQGNTTNSMSSPQPTPSRMNPALASTPSVNITRRDSNSSI